MYKANISENDGLLVTKGFEADDFYFGGRNIFIPFKESGKGIKVFFRDGDDPHRVMDQAFPSPPYHYDNPDKKVDPLSYNEFSILRNIHEFFEENQLGPEVFEETQIRINSNNYYALVVEDLSEFSHPSQEKVEFTREKIDNFLVSNGFFGGEWEDNEPSNYFETKKRGILAVDIDWGLIVHNKINNCFFQDYGYSIDNSDKGSDICMGSVAIGVDERDIVKNVIIPNFKDYCAKFEYDYYTLLDPIDVSFENNAYQETECHTLYKIILLERLLEKGYEYVVIIDSFDTLITNKDIKLEEFIDGENSIHLSTDIVGWDIEKAKKTVNINTGFAIYKNDSFTSEFIDSVKSVEVEWNDGTRRRINDQVLYQKFIQENPSVWDNISIGDPLQQSFWFYNKPNFDKNHEFLYNQHKSPYIWEEGDFMVHFAGQPNSNYLLEEFKNYIGE